MEYFTIFSLVPSIFCWYHTISNGGFFPLCHVEFYRSKLAPRMFQLHEKVHLAARGWVVGWNEIHLVEEPIPSKKQQLEEPIHPKHSRNKNIYIMCNLLIFVQHFKKFWSDKNDLRCLIWEQHLSGVRNPSASGSRVHHSMATFFYRLNIVPVAIHFSLQ